MWISSVSLKAAFERPTPTPCVGLRQQSHLKLGSGSQPGSSQAAWLNPPSRSAYSWATRSSSMLRISFPWRQLLAVRMMSSDSASNRSETKKVKGHNRRQRRRESPASGRAGRLTSLAAVAPSLEVLDGLGLDDPHVFPEASNVQSRLEHLLLLQEDLVVAAERKSKMGHVHRRG